MNFLLLSVCFTFSVIFHFFFTKTIGKDFLLRDIGAPVDLVSLSTNLFLETFAFLILGIVLALSFSSLETKKQGEEKTPITLKDILGFLERFFKRYLYYIGFFLFYFSVYLILSEFGVSFSYFVFIISIAIFCLFFLASKFYIFRDFIKVNTILFSLVYIANYLYSFTIGEVNFIEIDFINSFLILVFFVLTIYSDTYLLKKPHSDKALTLYFFVYLFLFTGFYIYLLLSSLTITLALLGFVFSLFCFFAIPHIGLFHNSIIPLRIFSFIFGYIGILFALLHGYLHTFSMLVFLILLFSGYFNFYTHRLYTNFVSLSFSFLAFWVFAFQFFFLFIETLLLPANAILFYSFSLSAFVILTPLFYNSKNIIEHYFFHIFSYILNIVGVLYFFVFNSFDILTFWVILLIESVFVFFSYYKINSLKNLSYGKDL